MHRAVEAYYRAATAALEADRQTAIKAWQVRQRRLQALLAVLEAAESEDSVAAALEELDATPCVPMPLGASLPTVFPPSRVWLRFTQ